MQEILQCIKDHSTTALDSLLKPLQLDSKELSTLLKEAIRHKSIDAIKLLVTQFNVKVSPLQMYHALSLATDDDESGDSGRLEVVDLLFDLGGAVSDKAIRFSVKSGSVRLTRLLIERGAPLNCTQDVHFLMKRKRKGKTNASQTRSTPLDIAISQGHKDVQQLLIDHGGLTIQQLNCHSVESTESHVDESADASVPSKRRMIETFLQNGVVARAVPSTPADMQTATTSTVVVDERPQEQHQLAILIRDEIIKLGGTSFLSQISSQRVQLGSFLGEGAFGKVYTGNLLSETSGDRSSTLVAVKQIPIPTDLQLKCTLAREIAVLTEVTQFNHGNIVGFLGFALDGPVLSLVLRMANAGNLKDFFQFNTDRMNLTHVVSICENIARGMSFLHDSLGITVIHGDLKTSNVLLQHHGTYYTAQIADFGLARALLSEKDRVHQSGTFGSVLSNYYQTWMRPPEGLIASKGLDVFCFGYILRQGITGDYPLGGEASVSSLRRCTARRPTPLHVDADSTAATDSERSSSAQSAASDVEIISPTTLTAAASKFFGAPTQSRVEQLLTRLATLTASCFATADERPDFASARDTLHREVEFVAMMESHVGHERTVDDTTEPRRKSRYKRNI